MQLFIYSDNIIINFSGIGFFLSKVHQFFILVIHMWYRTLCRLCLSKRLFISDCSFHITNVCRDLSTFKNYLNARIIWTELEQNKIEVSTCSTWTWTMNVCLYNVYWIDLHRVQWNSILYCHGWQIVKIWIGHVKTMNWRIQVSSLADRPFYTTSIG